MYSAVNRKKVLTLWWALGIIVHIDEGTGRGPSPPRPLLVVPNVTAHPSTASVPTSYYSMCTIIPCAHQRVKTCLLKVSLERVLHNVCTFHWQVNQIFYDNRLCAHIKQHFTILDGYIYTSTVISYNTLWCQCSKETQLKLTTTHKNENLERIKTTRSHMVPPPQHLYYIRCKCFPYRAMNERTNEGVYVGCWKILYNCLMKEKLL